MNNTPTPTISPIVEHSNAFIPFTQHFDVDFPNKKITETSDYIETDSGTSVVPGQYEIQSEKAKHSCLVKAQTDTDDRYYGLFIPSGLFLDFPPSTVIDDQKLISLICGLCKSKISKPIAKWVRQRTDTVFEPLIGFFSEAIFDSNPDNKWFVIADPEREKTNLANRVLITLSYDAKENRLNWDFHTQNMALASLFARWVAPVSPDDLKDVLSPLTRWSSKKGIMTARVISGDLVNQGIPLPIIIDRWFLVQKKKDLTNSLNQPVASSSPFNIFVGQQLAKSSTASKYGFANGMAIDLRTLSWTKSLPENQKTGTNKKEILAWIFPSFLSANTPSSSEFTCHVNKKRLLEILAKLQQENP